MLNKVFNIPIKGLSKGSCDCILLHTCWKISFKYHFYFVVQKKPYFHSYLKSNFF